MWITSYNNSTYIYSFNSRCYTWRRSPIQGSIEVGTPIHGLYQYLPFGPITSRLLEAYFYRLLNGGTRLSGKSPPIHPLILTYNKKTRMVFMRRSISETAMYRFKIIFAGTLDSRVSESPFNQAAIKYKILNNFSCATTPKEFKTNNAIQRAAFFFSPHHSCKKFPSILH